MGFVPGESGSAYFCRSEAIAAEGSFEQMRIRRAGTMAIVLAMGVASGPIGASDCKECAHFPVPRAEAEFDVLMEVPRGFASGGKPSLEQVLANLMPYGILDLEITGRATHDEISTLKNYYFGSVCRILDVDPTRLNAQFNCGAGCVEARRDMIRRNLTAWSEVANAFRAAVGVRLVGAWGAPEIYRVNDVIKFGKQTVVAKPSPVMGFIPGGVFAPQPGLAAALSERGINLDQVENLLMTMNEAGAIAARYRPTGALEVILIGVADNLSGILFLREGESPPKAKAEHENGSRYVLIEKLAENAYFFETR